MDEFERLPEYADRQVPINAPGDAGFLSALLDSTDLALISVGLSGIVLSWNRAATSLLGYMAAEIIGRSIIPLFAYQSGVEFARTLSLFDGATPPSRHEWSLQTKAGSVLAVQLTLAPIGKGDPAFSISVREVLRQQNGLQLPTRAELLSHHDMLAAITDNTVEAIFLGDEEGRLLFLNKSAERLTGWPLEECRGRLIHELIHHSHRDGTHFPLHACPLMEAYRNLGTVKDLEDILFKRDGSFIDVAYSNAPYLIDGKPFGAVLVAHDITERKRTEAALFQAQKMEAIGSLTGGLAHDFNNLLGVIIGSLDMLIDFKSTDVSPDELAHDALEAALRGADLTRSLLAFARRQPLNPELRNINHLIVGITRLLERTLGAGIDFRLDLDPSVWPVSIDPVQLETSLTNLATNARDAMPKGGCITISTSNCCLLASHGVDRIEVKTGEYTLVEFSDTGTGMNAETMDQIFEPFFTTKRLGEGSGLGLSMVFGFVKQSGGHIDVRSEMGHGSCFRIYLPRAARALAPALSSAEETALTKSTGTILVVEDDETLRKVLVRQLFRHGYTVLEAAEASDALDILRLNAVDLLFTDVVMPGGITGVELALTASKQNPALRVLLTSGFPDLRSDGSALEPSEWRLLTKPYRNVDVLRAIREVLTE